MNSPAEIPEPNVFSPHPNFCAGINRNIAQSEIEGGVRMEDLAPGETLEIRTQNRSYTLVNCGDGQALLSGHPDFCPQPVLVRIEGSNWGGSMLKASYIGRGMRLEFLHPEHRSITTSQILEIRSATA
jgi:hypothetical protein